MSKQRTAGIKSMILIVSYCLIIALTFSFAVIKLAPRNDAEASNTINYTTEKGVIYANGNPIQLRGVNIFGFDTSAHIAHGLWARNWREMLLDVKALGFNAVRLPVCPETLRGTYINTVEYSINPDLRGINSLQALDLFVAQLDREQIHILLDHHRPDCQNISELWTAPGYSESEWVTDLTFMAERYSQYPYFMGIDLKNEPHGAATWGTGNPATDWDKAAERAGKAINERNPNILVYVEGIQNQGKCSSQVSAFWGENLEPIMCDALDQSSIPANKLILSPHVYGPDVYMQSYFNDANFPGNMPQIWDRQFGSLTASYAIVPGEWGGKYGNGGSQKDVQFQNALVDYLVQKKICSSFYWSWNPNSGDTGGILKDDWSTPWDSKMQLLKRYYSGCDYASSHSGSTNPVTDFLLQPWKSPSPTSDSNAPTATIQLLSPKNKEHVYGNTVFAALVKNVPFDQYDMYWKVDNGQLNQMYDSNTKTHYKKANVDLSGWTWKQNGPYKITLIAKNKQGTIIATKSFVIYAG